MTMPEGACKGGLSRLVLIASFFGAAAAPTAAFAQQPPAAPAVGVVEAKRQPITQSADYIGRVQATQRVNIVPRVAAFIDEVLFREGADVKKGDLLYRLERGPFRADLMAKEASVAQFKAQLQNAQLVLGRAESLLKTSAGQQSSVDLARANEQALQAQVLGAEALLQQARINLDYTEIKAPIDGKIGRTAVTAGNFVSPATGNLVSIVSQDPMFVVFPVSTRTVSEVQNRRVEQGGGSVVVKVRLPDGRLYKETGTLDFIDNTVGGNTDTMLLRGSLANPTLPNTPGLRELVDGQLVNVILEDSKPTEALTIPRAAVLTDQGGDYVYVVGDDNRATQRRIKLGQSVPPNAAVLDGLKDGEKVVVDGIQRVRPGQPVSPGPAAAIPGAAPPPGTPPAARPAGGAAAAPAAPAAPAAQR
jgi:membrane fusion protein (multidrug efflux system)